ncbi:YlbF family regulator [Ruminococcus difficilis]|uniref:YlbF family regulator n=2 Tax=Ruminococcus TaxID=1263 RepID=A0A934TYZ9_9FIRM|nr:YlbF family regulator [Ruminococcus difficilis]MBK6087975.1 YlbF family regulator [Ruminococcus difficilis]
MADVIAIARQLGHAIQEQEEYKTIMTAKDAADNDEALQALITEFNIKRVAINAEACKTDRDDETLKKLNEEMRTAYSDIMNNEHMKAYNDAKQAFDKVLQRVLAIVQQSAEGQDPDTTDFSEDCTHDCSTCGGCG